MTEKITEKEIEKIFGGQRVWEPTNVNNKGDLPKQKNNAENLTSRATDTLLFENKNLRIDYMS